LYGMLLPLYSSIRNILGDLGAPNHRVVAPCSLVGCTL
jgi:hypothetical protein